MIMKKKYQILTKIEEQLGFNREVNELEKINDELQKNLGGILMKIHHRYQKNHFRYSNILLIENDDVVIEK